MKKWLDRAPHDSRDFLLLALGVALIFGAVSQLPAIASGFGTLMGILSPFAWGLVLAYILDIPTRFFAKKLFRGKRGFAIVLSYIVMAGVVALLIALVVPQIIQSVTSFVGKLGSYESNIQTALTWVHTTFGVDTDTISSTVGDISKKVQELLTDMSGTMAQTVADFATTVANTAMNGFVAFAVSVYLLADKNTLLHAGRTCLRAMLPPRIANSIFSVCTMANGVFSSYIGGQLVDALLVGCETFVLMTIFRLDYAPLIAVLVATTNIIPVLGPFIGAIPSIVILLLESPLQALIFAILILLVQQIDGNFIAPRILGGAIGMPGLAVLLAIIVGGSLFGIPGMVVGTPTLAVIVTLLKQAVGAGLSARGIDADGNPLPDRDAPDADGAGA